MPYAVPDDSDTGEAKENEGHDDDQELLPVTPSEVPSNVSRLPLLNDQMVTVYVFPEILPVV
jgi:hypothetical protein